MENQSPETVEKNSVERKKYTLKDFWKGWGDVVIYLVVLFILLRVVFQVIFVPSGSMESTMPTKSIAICWRLPYFFGNPMPDYGDIVTFNSEELDLVLVKRTIGLPGDVISFEGGMVHRNGEMIDEPYLAGYGMTYSGVESFTVPEDCVFFMGDNRMGSFDARGWTQPYIHRSELQAKALISISVGRDKSWQGVRIVAN